MDLAWEDVAENHRRARRHLETRPRRRRAPRAPARDVLHRLLDGVRARSRSRRAAPRRRFSARWRATLSIWILASIPEPGSRGRATWRCSPAPRRLASTRYAKIHPFSFGGEDRVYSGGERVVTVDGRRRARDALRLLRPALPGALPPGRGGDRPLRRRRELARAPPRSLAHAPARPRDREPLLTSRASTASAKAGSFATPATPSSVSPWGEILVEGAAEEAVLFADVDPAAVARRAREVSRARRPAARSVPAVGCLL